MSKQCQKCQEHVSDDSFICPHCGAILGDTMYIPKAVPVATEETEPKPEKRRGRAATYLFLSVIVILLVALLILMLPKVLYSADDGSKSATTGVTQQTNGPLTTYNLQLLSSDRSSMRGIKIQVLLGDEVVYTGITAQYGKASFTLPESDDYTIRLMDLPMKFQHHYEGSTFAFEKGSQDLQITLEYLPIPYRVKVVNEDDSPLEGVKLTFQGVEQQVEWTDEHGYATFYAKWIDLEIGYRVLATSAPVGYAANSSLGYYFTNGETELMIVMGSLKSQLREGERVYTVRYVDENGDPVPDQFVLACNTDALDSYTGPSSDAIIARGNTNADGFFSFIGREDQIHYMLLRDQPDYCEIFYSFEENAEYLEVHLDLNRKSYTYTVYVVDQFGEPYENAELYYHDPFLSVTQAGPYYTDENGMFTFESACSEPTLLSVFVSTGNFVTSASFAYNSRKLTIEVNIQSDITFTVRVIDYDGAPVVGACVEMSNLFFNFYVQGVTNEEGYCEFVLPGAWDYTAKLISLPHGYVNGGKTTIDYVNSKEIIFYAYSILTTD